MVGVCGCGVARGVCGVHAQISVPWEISVRAMSMGWDMGGDDLMDVYGAGYEHGWDMGGNDLMDVDGAGLIPPSADFMSCYLSSFCGEGVCVVMAYNGGASGTTARKAAAKR